MTQLAQPHYKAARVRLTRFIDNDQLEDKHWRSELKEVYLWENERWVGVPGVDESVLSGSSWSKNNLRPGERKAWTRGRDGWSGVAEDGSGDVKSVFFCAHAFLLIMPALTGLGLLSTHIQQQPHVFLVPRMALCRNGRLEAGSRGNMDRSTRNRQQ